tara:strand:- start:1224 stop:1874 length:651 start_codon:yes stop_codon:yes gene_type:complete
MEDGRMSNDGTMSAWHFTKGQYLRNGEPLPKVGEWLKLPGPPRMCSYGLHASVSPLDALDYAPGGTLHRVRIGGEIIAGTDKIVGTERRIIWTLDEDMANKTFREFARWCALQVIDKWDAPDVVREYLETGDESIRDASWDASWDAARDASWAASRAASWDAARDASRAAAWDASWAAAWDASWAASGAASGAAARAAQNKKLTSMLFTAHKEDQR